MFGENCEFTRSVRSFATYGSLSRYHSPSLPDKQRRDYRGTDRGSVGRRGKSRECTPLRRRWLPQSLCRRVSRQGRTCKMLPPRLIGNYRRCTRGSHRRRHAGYRREMGRKGSVQFRRRYRREMPETRRSDRKSKSDRRRWTWLQGLCCSVRWSSQHRRRWMWRRSGRCTSPRGN